MCNKFDVSGEKIHSALRNYIVYEVNVLKECKILGIFKQYASVALKQNK